MCLIYKEIGFGEDESEILKMTELFESRIL